MILEWAKVRGFVQGWVWSAGNESLHGIAMAFGVYDL